LTERKYNYIYGPVSSWRLGRSLGIDLLSQNDRICSFSCVYCQLGEETKYTTERKIYVPTRKIIDEIKSLPGDLEIDYYTFSGRGEPTLAKNFGETIEALRETGKGPIAVLTNASLIDRNDVQEELKKTDFVSLKLDAFSQKSFEKINRPAPGIKLNNIIEGIKKFKKEYKGRLALQIMFIDENKNHVEELIKIAKEINPDEVQINTPLRESGVRPLPKEEISKIKDKFEVLNSDIVSVYEAEHKKVKSISKKDTLKRRGKV
jgi:wyosine [tRNA(Phe)-imidazoG37] synthetase (radical SAM superfamily)